MGHIKEPQGIDFTVDPKQLTKEDLAAISDVIAHYKLTGKKKRISTMKKEKSLKAKRKKVNA